LIVFRSQVFGGISAEVLTIFNESNLGQMLKGDEFSLAILRLDFLRFHQADYQIVPPGGPAPGSRIAVADSAYARSKIQDEVPLYLPTPLPDDGSNPRVRVWPVVVVSYILSDLRVRN
jgi:hypothetical protein